MPQATGIGSMVVWKAPIKDGETTSPEFPAIIFRVYVPDPYGYAGIYIFTDEGILRRAKVPFSETLKEEHWSYLDALTPR